MLDLLLEKMENQYECFVNIVFISITTLTSTRLFIVQLPSFAKPGDWSCPGCQNMNWEWRDTCNQCNAAKPGTKADEKRTGRFVLLFVIFDPTNMTNLLI